MSQPILRNSQLEKLRQVDHSVFEARTIDMTWPVARRARRAWSGGSRRCAARPPSSSRAG